MLAVVTWDGGGGDLNWHNASNWSADTLPAEFDVVQIGGAFAGVTVISTASVKVASLRSEAYIRVQSGTFVVTGALTFNSDVELVGGTLDTGLFASEIENLLFSGGRLEGSGRVTIASSLVWTGGAMSGPGVTVLAPGASDC